MITTFETLAPGQSIEGPKFAVSRETIKAFCDASLDYNPLHLDDDYMKGSFGKTSFGGIIMHGMNNFGLITRMLTDWACGEWRATAAGDALARTGQARRYDPALRQDQGEARNREIAVGRGRCGGEQPARRDGRDRRGAGRVSAGPAGMMMPGPAGASGGARSTPWRAGGCAALPAGTQAADGEEPRRRAIGVAARYGSLQGSSAGATNQTKLGREARREKDFLLSLPARGEREPRLSARGEGKIRGEGKAKCGAFDAR
jgi:hypothetical protein